MEIKAIPEIIKSMDQLIRQGKYDDAYEFGKNNIDLNKEYSEGEYSFKNILEEYIFKIFIKDEISKTCPLMLDYSALYSNFAMASIYENQYEDAERSVELSLKYNPVNVNALLAKAELSRIKNNWDDFYKLNIKAIKFSYESKNLVMAFKNLAIHYLNKDTGKEDNGDLLEENIKTAIYLARISGEYDKDSNKPVSELNYIKNKTDTISNENIKEKIAEFEKTDLNEIKGDSI